MAPRLLIVDDMPDAIEFLPEWFKREGYETMMITRGQQALALAEEIRPDVILLDVMMPGMDGIETCRRLRRNPATSNIPVILVSARSPSEARAEGMLAGAADYVTKPIHFPDLLERVERLVKLNQGMSQDHRRLLEEMAYTALAVLPCNLAWLLVTDAEKRWLSSQAIAMDRGAEAVRRFLTLVQSDEGEPRWPLVHGSHPLTEVALNRTVLLDLSAERFRDLTGGTQLEQAFRQFDLAYISALPLVIGGRSVGVMLLAAIETRLAESRRAQQILNSLSNQAAMVIDNARLLADLAAREAQMQAEQAFRQMVLDTMGEGLIVVDEEAQIIYVNNRLLLLTGYQREALYGQSVGLVFHPDTREELTHSLTGLRRRTLSFAQRLYTRAGQEVPVLLSQAAAPSPDGRGRSTVIVLTDLSELQRNEEALKLQTQRLQAINHTANAMSSAHSLQDVVQLSVESALEVVQGVSAALHLRDIENGDRLVQVASVGPLTARVANRTIDVGKGLVGSAVSAACSQLIPDVTQHPRVQEEYAALGGPDVRSVIAAPLVAFDEVIGVLEVINKVSGEFDEQDLEGLESLSGSAAITIENARLFDQEHRRVTELSTLLDASAAVTSTLDFGDILERIARRLSLALQVERVVVANWNHELGQLAILAEVVNAYWLPAYAPVQTMDELPLTGRALESGRPVQINPAQAVATTSMQVERNPSRLHGVAAVPLLFDGQIVGAVTAYSEHVHVNLPTVWLQTIVEVVQHWQQAVQAYDSGDWLSRPNLTDLCQQVLQASGMQWCSVAAWDAGQREIRMLREIGHVLWLHDTQQFWDTQRFPSLSQVLEDGTPLTLRRDQLAHDVHEQAYLSSVGGTTCLVAPLFIRGEAGGLVKLIDTKPQVREFDQAEVSLCQGIANVVGNAMENAQLYAIQEQRASALEAAYKELQEADDLKEDLLQNLSHELRTPLTHILGYLRLLADGAFGALNAEQIETLNLVSHKAQSLADLVRDIVRVQESEAKHLKLKAVHLERVVALAVRSVAGKAQAKGIRIVPRIPANLPPAYADPGQVGEVFEELLENAIKFSPASTEIELALEETNGLMIHASVRDHGIGIPPEELDRIFRRFYQVDSGTTRHYGGTGLGLAIVRQVVEGHHGRIWVESEPGQGSCFHLTLPKATAIGDNG